MNPTSGADQTRDGFVGTPAFASPEQFARKEDRRVDTRSDIYSLGVTLWFLLCGASPFVGGTLDAISHQQKALSYGRLTIAKVPKQMVNLLRSMLAFDPAARPRSARELLGRLEACKKQVAASEGEARRRAKVCWLVLGLMILVVAGIGAGAYRYVSRAAAPVLGRPLAVMPFEDLSLDPSEASLAMGLQDGTARKLAGVAPLRVVNLRGKYYDSFAGRDPARICQDLGVVHLLTGRVRQQHGRTLLEVQLFDACDPASVWNASYDKDLAEILLAPGEIARSVAARVRAELPAATWAAMAEPLSDDPGAYDAYRRVHYGKPFFQSEEENNRYLREIGLPALEAAVERDPKFVLAYCDLADAYDTLSEITAPSQRETQAKYHQQAEAALAAARRLRPDDGEVHLALARHFYRINRQRDEAKIEMDSALRKLPDQVEVEELAGVIAYNQNRWDDALRHLERGAVLDPFHLGVGQHLINVYRFLRRYEDADRVSARIVEHMPRSDSLDLRLGRAVGDLEARADLAPLRATLRGVTPADQPQTEVMERFGLVLALCTHDADAVSDLLASTAQTNFTIRCVSYPKAWFVALTARLRHDEAGSRAALAIARNEVEQAVRQDPLNGRTLGLLAMIDAGLGRREEATREALHACELCPVETSGAHAPIVACNLAVVYAWTGQPAAACDVLEKWLQRPAGYNLPDQPSYGDLRLNPLWDPLRDDPRFVSLVARLAPAAKR